MTGFAEDFQDIAGNPNGLNSWGQPEGNNTRTPITSPTGNVYVECWAKPTPQETVGKSLFQWDQSLWLLPGSRVKWRGQFMLERLAWTTICDIGQQSPNTELRAFVEQDGRLGINRQKVGGLDDLAETEPGLISVNTPFTVEAEYLLHMDPAIGYATIWLDGQQVSHEHGQTIIDDPQMIAFDSCQFGLTAFVKKPGANDQTVMVDNFEAWRQ